MYSEALEQQVSLLRYIQSSSAAKYFKACNEAIERARGSEVPAWTAEAVRTCVSEPLRHGETFFWSTDTCTLLTRSVNTLPDYVLNLALLPSPAGFAWFSKPITSPIIGPNVMTGLLWHVVRGELVTGRGRSVLVVPLISADSRPAGLPLGAFQWDNGGSLKASREGPYTYEQQDEARFILRVFAAMLLFLDQRILVSSPQQAERHTRRRLEREGWESAPLIRVVELRKRERIGDKQPVQPVERDWSCQWIVRGHWRQQFYPSKHTTRPIWITPYVKGPDDKPLKPPRATVFAVIR